MKKTNWMIYIGDVISIIIGAFISGLALDLFLSPYNIAPGGVSGLAMMVNYLSGGRIPLGIILILFNIPLLILAYKLIGKDYAIKSIAGSFLYSVFVDLLAPMSKYISDNYLRMYGTEGPDLLLYAVFGGIMLGIGLGIIFRTGASTGGSDIVAQILNRKFPHVSTGKFMLAIDALIVFIAAFVYKSLIFSLYATIAIISSSKMIDIVVEGLNHSKAAFVISERSDEISDKIVNEMGRGVTYLSGAGAYTRKSKNILLCVISNRQILAFKRLIMSIDEEAFVVLSDVSEVLGEGFSDIRK